MSEKKEKLFDVLYQGAKETVKALKAPLVERAFKRKFQSAYDDADRIIDETEMKLFEERQRLQNADINEILQFKRELKRAKELQEEVRKEYKEIFDEELK